MLEEGNEMSIGAEIIAIDTTDHVGVAEDWTTLDIAQVNFSDVNTFVDAVLQELGDRQLDLLHIQVHGSPNAIWFGANQVNSTTFSASALIVNSFGLPRLIGPVTPASVFINLTNASIKSST